MELSEEDIIEAVEETLCDVEAEEAKAVIPERLSEDPEICDGMALRTLEVWLSSPSSLLRSTMWRGVGGSPWGELADQSCGARRG